MIEFLICIVLGLCFAGAFLASQVGRLAKRQDEHMSIIKELTSILKGHINQANAHKPKGAELPTKEK